MSIHFQSPIKFVPDLEGRADFRFNPEAFQARVDDTDLPEPFDENDENNKRAIPWEDTVG